MKNIKPTPKKSKSNLVSQVMSELGKRSWKSRMKTKGKEGAYADMKKANQQRKKKSN